ncbi:MAG: Asp-tRNA(Asn)/Glu-tRNA(Gln) amidotransferase subunit GatA [Planctomycetaceae bacterium]|jgi:aspartyl-tRNA(Asn)/glutamyl-tRNA(Gln) amidotransferase subunit A|nr:Asp-tRNA(Asn)/Glu-tRNA(Gln) amidotransferase subunit GatA [Planctomycetaceae bacterium]
MSIISKSATQQREMLRTGELTSVELTTAYLKQIKSRESAVKAFVHLDEQQALDAAQQVDTRRAAGEPLGELAGIPVAVKDNLCSQGVPTTCASKILNGFIPPYDATVVAKLKTADAVLIGRTNMDEFAMGSSTENSAIQVTNNPWDLQCIPGGSSGGSAACIAADFAPLALGSDTGGSIRQPAALCGIVGLKPSYGRVSRYGLVAFASSLDQIGPMTGNVEDAALLLQVLAGHDSHDSTSADVTVDGYADNVTQPLSGLTLGVVAEHYGEGLDTEIKSSIEEAIRVYESLGATIKQIEMPHASYGIATYYIIAPCEASSNLARFDGAHYGHRADIATVDKTSANEDALTRMYRSSRAAGFGDEVKRRIMLGTYALSEGYYDAFYLKALKVRRLIRQDYDNAFKDVDLLIGPVTARSAFQQGKNTADPMAMYMEDLFTVTANLAGVAGISIPCGFTKAGLPIGVQLQSAPFQEDKLLRAAYMFQNATDWHQRRPDF